MVEGSRALAVLAVMIWTTLVMLVAVFLRISLRPDAGFGAAGRRRDPPHRVRARKASRRFVILLSRISSYAPRR